jgi:predicted polyphosphate/ATP-dependent NAD kinase
MRRIGFVVNPVAGMGGLVGLKGTDGKVEEARARGAVPRAHERAKITLELLAKKSGLKFLTCAGPMGEEILRAAGIENYEICYQYEGESSADDTQHAAQRFRTAGVDLILFCGGDGTARDIFCAVGRDVPILGIPAGVKMYSAVFAIDPKTAAEIVSRNKSFVLRDSEVMDVDEEAYRGDILKTQLYGIARVPFCAGRTQVSKHVFEEADEERAKQEIARFIGEVILPDTLYILGAGTTTEAIARHIGVAKTLLGVDVIKNGKLVAQDADEQMLLDLTEAEKEIRIITSPIGAQGFILGRGNQQISAPLVRRVGGRQSHRRGNSAQTRGNNNAVRGHGRSGARCRIREFNTCRFRIPYGAEKAHLAAGARSKKYS